MPPLRFHLLSARASLALLCFACVAALGACGDASEWRELEVSEGGFAVLMRAAPHYVKQDIDTPAGKMTAHLYSSDRPNSYYAVGYVDYPIALVAGSQPEQLFANVRDTWVRRIQGKLVATDDSPKLGGKYPGVEFSAEGTRTRDNRPDKLAAGKPVATTPQERSPDKPATTYLQARLYLVDQRLYQVIAMGRKGEVPQGEMNRFLKSFRQVTQSEVGSIKIDPQRK